MPRHKQFWLPARDATQPVHRRAFSTTKPFLILPLHPTSRGAAARLEGESTRTVAITRRERYTLLAIRRMFDVFNGTPFAEDVESLLAKLLQRTTAKERAELAADRDRFAYIPDGGTKAYRGKEDVIDALQTGVLMRRVVKFSYRAGRGRASRGYLAPFSLVVFKHGLYVLGRRLDDPAAGLAIPRGAIERLAVERFTEVEALRGHVFTVPADFRLDDEVQSGFDIYSADVRDAYRVVVEFSSSGATLVELEAREVAHAAAVRGAKDRERLGCRTMQAHIEDLRLRHVFSERDGLRPTRIRRADTLDRPRSPELVPIACSDQYATATLPHTSFGCASARASARSLPARAPSASTRGSRSCTAASPRRAHVVRPAHADVGTSKPAASGEQRLPRGVSQVGCGASRCSAESCRPSTNHANVAVTASAVANTNS